jgi:hypothetical protein
MSTAGVLLGLMVTVGPPPSTDLESGSLVSGSRPRSGHGKPRFGIEAMAITGMYPGASRRLALTVTNPYRFRLRVGSLRARVTSTSRSGCAPTAANLRVGDFTGRLPITVPAHGRTTLSGSVPVTMPRNANPNCAGARFVIQLSGKGRRADR